MVALLRLLKFTRAPAWYPTVVFVDLGDLTLQVVANGYGRTALALSSELAKKRPHLVDASRDLRRAVTAPDNRRCNWFGNNET